MQWVGACENVLGPGAPVEVLGVGYKNFYKKGEGNIMYNFNKGKEIILINKVIIRLGV